MVISCRKHCIFVMFLALPFNNIVGAESLNQVQQNAIQNNQSNAESQQRINQMDDATRQMLERYRVLLKENTQLQNYSNQLAALLEDQNRHIQRYKDEIATANEFERGVLPMLARMIHALENFIKRDSPFLQEERLAHIKELATLMRSSNTNAAEKFSQVIHAYQDEISYGNNIETYRGEIILNGEPKTVDFLRVGRNILIYQTFDQKVRAVWDEAKQDWQSVGDEYRRPIHQAILIARKQAAPNIFILPVPATYIHGVGNENE